MSESKIYEVAFQLGAEVLRLTKDLEQERITHAGCLTAAEGWVDKDRPKKGDWAWSPALQAVMDLRDKYDALRECYKNGT